VCAYVIGKMFPPAQGLRLDIDAISQIFGSISIESVLHAQLRGVVTA
jgi:hypothetical protein